MRRYAAVLAIVACLSVGGPSAAEGDAPATPVAAVGAGSVAADVEEIRSIGRRWREYYSGGRFAEIPDLYTEDTLVMPRGRPAVRGRAEMRRAIGGLAAGRRVAIEVTERDVFVAGDYAWFVGDFRVTYTPTGANVTPTVEHGRSLIIFRRDRDGRWRIHRDMDNPAPLPVAETPPSAKAPSVTPPLWDPAARATVTACDRLASSRYDRTRLAPPVARESIDVPAAIAQCEADLATLPGDPRLHFHLGRLYGYAGDRARTLQHRQAAAAAGNHNAIFLLGYLSWGAAADDAARCAAARQMKLAADRGNYSAQVTYTSFALEGSLAACSERPTQAELAAYVAGARPTADGFFEIRLIEHLAAEARRQHAN